MHGAGCTLSDCTSTYTHVGFMILPSLSNPLEKSTSLEHSQKPVLFPKIAPSVMDGKAFEQLTCLPHQWDEFVGLELSRSCLF